jgi:Ribbon-helix-helix protein, copG family
MTGVSLAHSTSERKSKHMPQVALNPGGGTAVLIQARVPDPDVTRLAALAARRGVRQPVLIRRALALGLDELEREQGQSPDN